ncbi:MAG: glycosyltransferase family 1 protein [Nitrospirae bacterium]|nr:MAG: glycosyltransferase family 1 protein [Nitrospirota bacterium]
MAAAYPKASMMRIGIDAGPAFAGHGGVGQYVRGLLTAFSRLDLPHEWALFIPPGRPAPSFPWVSETNGATWIPHSRWPWASIRKERVDIFHGTNFKVPIRGTRGTVVTIHDLWLCRYPQYSKKFGGERWALARLKRRVWSADRVIAVSHATERDIQEFTGLPLERIRVVYHGVPEGYYPDSDEMAWNMAKQAMRLPDRPFLLFVGGADPRKNHRVVFRALSRASWIVKDFALVLVGSRQARGMDIEETAKSMGLRSGIFAVGAVSQDQLRLLYTHATAFVFPSLYEGFGFPVLEAMTCGAPVITSKTTALPEVAGDAAILIDPHDEGDLLKALEHLLGNEDARRELIAKGLERVKQFTWERTALQTLELYEEVGSL